MYKYSENDKQVNNYEVNERETPTSYQHKQ